MFIIKKKVKNSIYLYLGESYRNENGQPRNRRIYLGKIDEDGILITSKRKLPINIKEIKTITKKFIFENSSKHHKKACRDFQPVKKLKLKRHISQCPESVKISQNLERMNYFESRIIQRLNAEKRKIRSNKRRPSEFLFMRANSL